MKKTLEKNEWRKISWRKKDRRSKKRNYILPDANLIIDFDNRIITLDGSIYQETAIAFQQSLFTMQEASIDPITIKIINSTGGDFVASMMIYHLLKSCFVPTIGIVSCFAGSGACYVFQGTSERIMKLKSHISLHWAVKHFEDQSLDIKQLTYYFKRMSKLNKMLYELIYKKTNLPLEKIKELCENQTRLDPKVAIKLSLADKIHNHPKKA